MKLAVLAGAAYVYATAPKAVGRAGIVVGLLLVYEVFLKPPPPRGDVEIGDVEFRSTAPPDGRLRA